MSDAVKPLLAALADGLRPEDETLIAGFAALMDGQSTPAQTGALVMGLQALMRDPGVIAVAARAMRERMIPLPAPDGAIDVCGTGGDGAKTLNVSTAVAFVVAGSGVPVAKHGNRAMSSRSGAADVLEALGVDLAAPSEIVARALSEANVAFLFAQAHHPAMRHVAPARRELGFRTLFNVLGPVCNPAGVKRQLLGVFDPSWLQPLAEALRRLGCEKARIVHGGGGLDEVSLEGKTHVAALDPDGTIEMRVIDAADFGLPEIPVSAIAGGEPAENARALTALLNGQGDDAYRNYVLANAAVALMIAGRARDLREGVALGKASLDSGAARHALDTLIAISRER